MKKLMLIGLLTLATLMTTSSVAHTTTPWCPPLCTSR
jgi:hypothetical protein